MTQRNHPNKVFKSYFELWFSNVTLAMCKMDASNNKTVVLHVDVLEKREELVSSQDKMGCIH